MPDDLRRGWGDASAGEALQIQMIISREIWLHRDHSQLCADYCQNPVSESQLYVCILSCVRLFVTLWTVACKAPLSMGFPRQEY